MKKLLLALTLSALGTGPGILQPVIVQNAKNKFEEQILIVGQISDSKCGLKHMAGTGDDKTCTLMCVKHGGNFVLADRAHNLVYALDKPGQKQAREFAGQRVAVTGRITGHTIHVTSIAPGTSRSVTALGTRLGLSLDGA